MTEADLVNIYIVKLTTEINECTKRRLLLEAQLDMANKQIGELTSLNTSLEVENEKLKSKKKTAAKEE